MGYNPTLKWHPTTPLLIISFLLPTPTSSFPTPPSSPPLPPPHNYSLKPSMTIIIGLLTTIFSITFLLLLYAKHCRRSRNHYPPGEDHFTAARSIDRDNSGIDRTIIDSLPVFRFGSLTGQKDGLECAVCLSRFNPSEILRLLPKCKHAFHVECVDTWLDAHSTCPLCRYRVDPEDIFLIVGETELRRDTSVIEEETEVTDLALKRVSGRHSSAGENVTTLSQLTTDPSSPSPPCPAAGSRRSLDSWSGKKKNPNAKKKRKEDTPAERHRKDGTLLALAEGEEDERRQRRRGRGRRFEHRIVVGTERWSDVQPSDLLYLRSEMVVSDVRRLKRSRPSEVLHEGNKGWWQGVVNSRSVSEITGLSRFGSNEVAGTVSRLLARLTEPKSGRNSSSSNV